MTYQILPQYHYVATTVMHGQRLAPMRGDPREQSHQTHIAESFLVGHKEPVVAQCNDGVVGEVRGTAQVDHPLPIQKGEGHAHVGVVCTADKHKVKGTLWSQSHPCAVQALVARCGQHTTCTPPKLHDRPVLSRMSTDKTRVRGRCTHVIRLFIISKGSLLISYYR